MRNTHLTLTTDLDFITRCSQEPVITHLVFNLTSIEKLQPIFFFFIGHLMKFLLIVIPAILDVEWRAVMSHFENGLTTAHFISNF